MLRAKRLSFFSTCSIVGLRLSLQNSLMRTFRVPLFFLICLLFCGSSLRAQTNLALNKPITASAALISGYPVTNVVDGNAATFTHPNAASGNTGFYYQIDLGATYTLSSIVLRNRANCCPERLSNDSVRVFADNGGVPGAQNWIATLRADGSNSGMGGVDTMVASANPTGTFAGRFIRVVNLNGAGYNPQIAELEVYGLLPPKIVSFVASDETISTGETVSLSWNVEGTTSLTLNPGAITLSGATGTYSVSPTVSTTYTLSATGAGGTSTATVNIGVNVTQTPPLITELLAENDGGLNDQDDESPDWIELTNSSPYRFDLVGHFLTNKADIPAQWAFPAGASVPGNGRLVVFCSGKNYVNPAVPLHTNFKLSNAGDYIALVGPGSVVLHQIPATYPVPLKFPAQQSNISYGRDSDGVFGYMQPPTPGAANGAVYSEIVQDPAFSVARGFYDLSQNVALTTTTVGATIRYTTNGAAPTSTTGTVYTAPVAVTATTILRAAAYKTGAISSDVRSNTYIFLNSLITSPVFTWANGGSPTDAEKIESLRDLPSVSISTGSTILTTAAVPASIEWIRPDGVVGFQENCGVENYGNSAAAFAKRAMRISFKGEYGATSLNYPIYEGYDHGLRPVTQFDTIDFRAGEHDMRQRGFYMGNIFTDDTMLETGTMHPHGRFVHMYLNGVYHGVYHAREHWDAKMAARYLGGSDLNYETINGNANIGVTWDVGSIADGDGSAWARIKSLRSNFSGVRPFIDIGEYTDWLLMWMFGRCEGEYRIAGPSVAGSGFKIFLNDGDGFLKASDSTWDGWGDRLVYTAAGLTPTRKSGDGPGDVFSGLWNANTVDHRVFLSDRIYRMYFNSGVLTPARNDQRLRTRCAQIEKALKSECARWYSNSATNFRTYPSWIVARDSVLNTWMPPNTATVLGQLRTSGFYPPTAENREAPLLNQQGGSVSSGFVPTFTGPSAPVSAQIYYTLDGSDPRLPGGAISPAAQLCVVGVSPTIPALTKSAIVKSRHKNASTGWSALNEAYFQVGNAVASGDIVISELNYNPTAGDAQEFIELRNIGTRAVNLRNTALTAGVAFTFSDYFDTVLAPGERIVIVKDLFAFRAAYGTEVPVAGIYDGNLDDGGELITFSSAQTGGTTLDSFTYDGALPWPQGADGGGYSLARVLPATSAASQPEAWRNSTTIGGNPAGSDAVSFTGVAASDGDLDALPALVEHALGTNPSSNTSGPGVLVAGVDVTGRLTLTFPHNLLTEDVSCVCETSDDLVTWTPAEMVTRVITGSMASETWRSATTSISAQYIRLRVTMP